jgi:sulfur relay (sulfurtransferase) complex TusBCD TusD component (DsrE family)
LSWQSDRWLRWVGHESSLHPQRSAYGTQQAYNALRLAHGLVKKESQTQVTVFLMTDSAVGAKAGQKTPDAITMSSGCSSAC